MQTLTYLILVPMVYFAVAVFIFGTAARLFKILSSPKNPSPPPIYPQKRGPIPALADAFLFPTVRRHNPVLWIFLVIFHVCLILLFLGHLELITEMSWLQTIPHEIFLGKGFVGLATSLSLLFFLFRRFHSPIREISIPEDYYLLILLFIVVLFGSQMDWARQWFGYGEMAVEDYREYLFSMVSLSPELPDSVLFSGHSFLLTVHVFFANLFLIFFPFSQAMHAFLSVPVNRLRRG